MPKNFQKSTIVNKIRNLVKTSSTFLRKKDEKHISKEIAIKIQKNAFELSKKPEKKSFTHPCHQIAEQLQVKDDNIIKAATHALINIAIASPKYKEVVKEILITALQDPNKSQDQLNYISDNLKALA